MTTQLSVRSVSKQFGGLAALKNISFAVESGAIVGVMGANGAGKTTLFSLIAGNAQPSSGDIVFESRSLLGLRPDQVCRLGIARTFQIVKPFPGLTVLENVRTAALFGHRQCRTFDAADRAAQLVIEEVGLSKSELKLASTLTLSGQKRLELARAVASGARLVLLDEVLAGLTPTEVGQMLVTLRQLHKSRGLTLLVIEHVMRALMELCDHIVVLHHGELIASGTPGDIGRDRRVLDVYLGSEDG